MPATCAPPRSHPASAARWRPRASVKRDGMSSPATIATGASSSVEDHSPLDDRGDVRRRRRTPPAPRVGSRPARSRRGESSAPRTGSFRGRAVRASAVDHLDGDALPGQLLGRPPRVRGIQMFDHAIPRSPVAARALDVADAKLDDRARRRGTGPLVHVEVLVCRGNITGSSCPQCGWASAIPWRPPASTAK